jgi:hypothetical protein
LIDRYLLATADMPLLKYIELKTGFSDDGPAWIAHVTTSRSGRTVYFDGKALKQAPGLIDGTHYDLGTGDEYWVTGVKKCGTNRHWAGSGKILVERAAVSDLLKLLGEPELDDARFVISDEIRRTDAREFVDLENERLEPTGEQ